MKKLLLLFFIASLRIFASFELAPPVHTLDLSRVRTAESVLINDTNKLIRVKVYPKKPDDQPTNDLYMGDWTVIYPQLVYLKPNSRRAVRIGVRTPDTLKDGEYRTEVVFEQLPSEGEDATDEVRYDSISTIISTIYGVNGELIYGADTLNFGVRSLEGIEYIYGSIKNTGNVSVKTFIDLEFYDANNKKIGTDSAPGPKVIRENSSPVSFPKSIVPEGTSSILLKASYLVPSTNVELDDEKVLLDEIKFDI